MMHVEQYENVGHAGEHQTTQEQQLGGGSGVGAPFFRWNEGGDTLENGLGVRRGVGNGAGRGVRQQSAPLRHPHLNA